MPVNKVNYGNTTLIDLSNDTAEQSDVVSGKYFTDRTGTRRQGTLSFITYYTGTTDPSSSLGNDGDIYLKVSS